MKSTLDEERPIYIQIKEHIENAIINETMKADERIPSTNEFAKHFQINPATASKGVNELVSEGILYKRRGVGMFVNEDARNILIEKRKEQFLKNYIVPLKKEAKKLGITNEGLIEMIDKGEMLNEN